MRKVSLSMKAQEKFEIIKRVAGGHITKNIAAVKIGCTVRNVDRLLNTYPTKGKAGFLHGKPEASQPMRSQKTLNRKSSSSTTASTGTLTSPIAMSRLNAANGGSRALGQVSKQVYKSMDSNGMQVHYHQRVKGLVIQTFTEGLLFSTHDNVYALVEMPLHEQTSRNFDIR